MIHIKIVMDFQNELHRNAPDEKLLTGEIYIFVDQVKFLFYVLHCLPEILDELLQLIRTSSWFTFVTETKSIQLNKIKIVIAIIVCLWVFLVFFF